MLQLYLLTRINGWNALNIFLHQYIFSTSVPYDELLYIEVVSNTKAMIHHLTRLSQRTKITMSMHFGHHLAKNWLTSCTQQTHEFSKFSLFLTTSEPWLCMTNFFQILKHVTSLYVVKFEKSEFCYLSQFLGVC